MVRNIAAALVVAVFCGCPAPEAKPLAADKGTVSGMPTTAVLGAAGGSLVAGTLTLTVPAGVLSADTTFTATPITATAPGARGKAMRLGPEGQTFTAPVKVTFSYVDEDVAGASPEALLIAFQHSSGVWAVPGDVTLDTTARTVTVETTHFSDWSMVAGAQLLPPNPKVKLGASQAFSAVSCFKPYSNVPDPLLVGLQLGFPCGVSPSGDEELAPLSPLVKDWAVNSVVGGGSTTGTISGDGVSASFTAPGAKPMGGVVAVSARLQAATRSTLLVANVTLVDGPRITVSGRYARGDQLLTAHVRGDVADDGFEFEMDWKQSEGNIEVKNKAGNSVTNLRDERIGCVPPALDGDWDELQAGGVTIVGSYFQVNGVRSVPAINVGVGEGDCLGMTRREAPRLENVGLQVMFPAEFFSSVDPPPVGSPIVSYPPAVPGWVFTYSSVP